MRSSVPYPGRYLRLGTVIDRGAPELPWVQRAAVLRSQIVSGELAPGASTNTLSQTYELSTSTVRKP